MARTLKISDMHAIVHEAEATGKDLAVAVVVDEGNDSLVVHRVKGVYIDEANGIVSIVAVKN